MEYITSKRKEDIKIDEFLIRFYIDKMLNLKYGKDNVKICKQIIQDSDTFTKNIALLGLDTNKEKEFIVLTSNGKKYSYKIDACPKYEEVSEGMKFEDFPFDVEYEMDVLQNKPQVTKGKALNLPNKNQS